MKRIATIVESWPWIWSILASLLMWIAIGVLSKQMSVQTLVINATVATFLAIIAIGQMFAISGGDGGIDLSIPYTVTLTAFVSEGIMQGSNGKFVQGMVVCLVAGLLIGVLNAFLILGFKIPPIIGTLSSGYIVDSAGLVYAHGFSSGAVSPVLTGIVTHKVVGIPWVVILTICLGLVFAIVLNRSPFGKALLAMGQNRVAAQLAGIRVNRIRTASFILSGVLAAFGGVMLSAYSGGAFLGMGSPFLLESIGAVVIGGTLISGGKSTTLGTLGGALFLTMVVTLMEVTKLAIGIQDILEGVIVILVLLIANRETAR